MKLPILTLAAVLTAQAAFSQINYMGCEIDTVLARQTPMRAPLTRDITNTLPKAVSLQKFTPIPGNQGQTGTCTAWSSTYCIRTMLWAMSNGCTKRSKITSEAYLPAYTYLNILKVSTHNCSAGTDIADACYWLTNVGAVKLSLHSDNPACMATNEVPSNWRSLAGQNKAQGYTKLFYDFGNKSYKVEATKKALAAGHPVLIATKCPNSMCASTGINSQGLWRPISGENYSYNYSGHALAVVAYDDAAFNNTGAFLIQNSWGTDFGIHGYFWMTYYDYAGWIYYAFDFKTTLKEGSSIDKDCNHFNFDEDDTDWDIDGDGEDDDNNIADDDDDYSDNNDVYALVDDDFMKQLHDKYGIDFEIVEDDDDNNKVVDNDDDDSDDNSYDDNDDSDDDSYDDDDNNYSYDDDDDNYNDNNNDDYDDGNNNDNNGRIINGKKPYCFYNSDCSVDWNKFNYYMSHLNQYYSTVCTFGNRSQSRGIYTSASYSDTKYNGIYQDGDKDAWKGYTADDYTKDDYSYTYDNSDMAYTDDTPKANLEKSYDRSVKYDNDNTYDTAFCKTEKMNLRLPSGQKISLNKLSGSFKLLLNDYTTMGGKLRGNVIEMDREYKGGTRFRVYVSNNQPAYVYVFGTDLTNNTYHIFPQSRLISPYLDYVDSRVAFPDERHWIEMDNTPGTDYLYVLYSLVPLNIDRIEREMREIKGDYANKIFKVMGPKALPLSKADVTGDSHFHFNALTDNKQTMVAIIKFSHVK